MELCNSSNMAHMNSQIIHASFKQDFISLACKFTAVLKKSHSLLDDPRRYKIKFSMEVYGTFIYTLYIYYEIDIKCAKEIYFVIMVL